MFYIIPLRKSVYLQNLRTAFPNHDEDWYNILAKTGYKFFMERFIEFFSFPNSFPKAIIKIVGQKKLDAAFKKGKGVVFISGHFGAWELLSAWVSSNGYPVTAIAAKQKNRGSDRFFMEHRGQFGMKHVYRKSSIDEMYDILKKNEAIALVSDQDARKRGVFVDFFGRKASTPKGAARFYLKAGVPLIFTLCYKVSQDNYVIEFVPVEPKVEATVESITQTYTKILEDFIRKYPEQYFWFHRRWKTKPPS
jgi:KDO2-lipid IV(A) lauroyltransferase